MHGMLHHVPLSSNRFKRAISKVSRLRQGKMRVTKYYLKIKHYLGHENKINENIVLSYCDIYLHL